MKRGCVLKGKCYNIKFHECFGKKIQVTLTDLGKMEYKCTIFITKASAN